MEPPLTEQQKQNLASILRKAKVMIARNKSAASARGELDQAIFIANREAQIESFFATRGVTLDERPVIQLGWSEG